MACVEAPTSVVVQINNTQRERDIVFCRGRAEIWAEAAIRAACMYKDTRIEAYRSHRDYCKTQWLKAAEELRDLEGGDLQMWDIDVW